MKIGFVLDDSLDKTDGVQQYILTLGNWFRSHGHEVHYLVGDTRRTDVPNIHSLSRNLQVHFNQNRMSTPLPASKTKIKQLLTKEQFDVLHVQLPYSPFLAARVINLAPPETLIVGTFHILPFSKIESVSTRLLAAILWRSRRKFDQIYSVSGPAAKFAKKRFRVSSKVLPNAVAVSQFRSAKKLNKYNDGKINIIYLGRLVERKGCLHFLKALELLHSKNQLQNVRVVIAGKGPLESELKQFVKNFKLGKIVNFIGYVSEEDKPSLLASANIAVMPSTGGESFGIVLVEAMAAGAEVVLAGNNSGYRTVMGNQKAQLIDPINTTEFSKTLKHFIYNQPARLKAQAWQAKRVNDYDVKLIGQKLIENYNQLLRNKTSVR